MGNASFQREVNDMGEAIHRLTLEKHFPWEDALAPEVEVQPGKRRSPTADIFALAAQDLQSALGSGNGPSQAIEGFTAGEEVLAVIVMRAMEVAQARGWDLGAAIRAKFLHDRHLPGADRLF